MVGGFGQRVNQIPIHPSPRPCVEVWGEDLGVLLVSIRRAAGAVAPQQARGAACPPPNTPRAFRQDFLLG